MSGNLRALKDIYDTETQSYEELLDLRRKKKIHTQNFQILMVEIYQCLNNISPPFTWYHFKQKNSLHSLRNTQLLEVTNSRTNMYGLNTTLFKGILLWNKMSNHFTEVKIKKNSKIKFENGQRVHAHVVSAIKLFSFIKRTHAK